MIINDLDDYYIVFDTKNRNTELDTLIIVSSLSLNYANLSSHWLSIYRPKWRMFSISCMDIPYIPLMSIAGEGRGNHRWRRRHLEESLA